MFAFLASSKYFLYTSLQEGYIDKDSIVAFMVPVFCIISVMIGVMGTAMPSMLTRNYAAQQPDEENRHSKLDYCDVFLCFLPKILITISFVGFYICGYLIRDHSSADTFEKN